LRSSAGKLQTSSTFAEIVRDLNKEKKKEEEVKKAVS